MTSPGQCIAVASGKGGTGKTSFTAGVGAALALSGRRVLCLDCDIGLRNLDLALGLSDRPVTEIQMADLLREVRRRFDFCLLDAPAGLGRGFQLATCAADRCVVVTTADASSLRDAQHTVMELDRFPAGALHLVVNRVRKKLLRQLHATIDDAIDKAGLPLLGVVPEDDALPLCMNRGVPILLADGQSAATAYRNIAKRLQGERVPLLRIR